MTILEFQIFSNFTDRRGLWFWESIMRLLMNALWHTACLEKRCGSSDGYRLTANLRGFTFICIDKLRATKMF